MCHACMGRKRRRPLFFVCVFFSYPPPPPLYFIFCFFFYFVCVRSVSCRFQELVRRFGVLLERGWGENVPLKSFLVVGRFFLFLLFCFCIFFLFCLVSRYFRLQTVTVRMFGCGCRCGCVCSSVSGFFLSRRPRGSWSSSWSGFMVKLVMTTLLIVVVAFQ